MLDKNIFGEVPQVVHNAVLKSLESLEKSSDTENKVSFVLTGKQKRRERLTFRPSGAAAVCIACFLIFGITASAMGVIHLYRQRMEEMNEKSLEEYYLLANAGEATELSRPYTAAEAARYEELNEAYENNGLFPAEQMTCLQNADEYDGKKVALDSGSRTLYLPDRELSDEELLEIIDFNHKISYSIYAQNEERIKSESDWKSRMAEMDDAKVDEVYLTMFSGDGELSGSYSRQFSETESRRYAELAESYEKEGLFTMSEPAIIRTPEEYTGVGIAICVKDSTFYFPDRELTDDEFLQLIDFEHKATYCIDKINREIQMGFREGFPQS